MAIAKTPSTAVLRYAADAITFTIGGSKQQVMRSSMNNRAKKRKGTVAGGSTKRFGSTRATNSSGQETGSGTGPSSTGFQELDALIIFLDELYDQLPP